MVFILDKYKRPLNFRLVQGSSGHSHGKEDAAPSSPQLKPEASGAAEER